MNPIKERRIKQDWLFPLVNTIFLILLMFITLYPVINTVAYSFNDGIDALRGNIGLWPRKFSLESYKSILSDKSVFMAAWISASKTVLITLLNLFWTSMLAYALSRKEFVFRKLFTVIMVLTMYVNAGLIPNYLLISKTLNLRNTYLVYIIPSMFSCFNMIVIRTYISNLPDALIESARIDGAGDFRIFWQIIFPLCKPVLATVALFVAVGSWNSWFDTKLYNNNAVRDPQTLQLLLQEKIATAGQQSSNSGQATADALLAKQDQKGELAIRAAITVISTVPILVVYPILQKYFVTGMALGSVKG
jgi:putative aldouronate transport system permease protein